MVDVLEPSNKQSVETAAPVRARTRETTDIRRLIPSLGLKEYWYPALEAKRVKNRPVGLTILGEEVVFFHGKDGQVKALWNVCPHRGGSLMHGDCHYPGTISCPYHGWTFDGDGNVLAVLPEGPESKVPGKVRARVYPTVTLKGMVFIWMGEGDPAPLEEDVPPEFFDDHTMILFHTEMWPVNWNVALENGSDAHVPYVHRDAVRTLMFPMGPTGPIGVRNKIVNGRMVATIPNPARANRIGQATQRVERQHFPALRGYWPKHSRRSLWTWMFRWARKRVASMPQWEASEEWLRGHHLPGMFRNDHRTDMYTRVSIAVTANRSRQIYFKAVRPKSAVGRWYERIHYRIYGRWMQISNFSRQDMKAVAPQRYDTPEYLSSTDTHQVAWRRLVLQARGMDGMGAKADDTEAEKFSYARQAEVGSDPEKFTDLWESAHKR